MSRHLPEPQIRRHKTVPTALRIAVIVRTKDRPHLLARSLQSLLEQDRRPNEVIVVNDGGVAIDDVVNGFSKMLIHLINNATNQGRARAGNQGVQACQSDVIAFLDDDDRFLPDHLQRLEKSMLAFDAKVAYSGCRLLKRDILGEKVILQEKAIGQFNEPYDAERLRYENYIPLINLLIDKALWLEIGGFDESFDMFEDWDVLLRLSLHTAFYHVNCMTADYAIWGNTQITQSRDQQRWRDVYRQFLEKHLMPLPATKQLEYLAEYWRVSQERRGIMQDTTVEKQDLQLQLIQNTQTVEELRRKLQDLQQEKTQLQSDWGRKYDQLQSEHRESQSDWKRKHEQLQAEHNQSQANWRGKYERLQAEHNQSQADWRGKYELLQADKAKQLEQLQSDWTRKHEQLQSEHTQSQSDWSRKYEQLQSEQTQSQSDWSRKYEQLQSEHAKQFTQLQSDWTTKYERLQSDYTCLQSDWMAKYEQLQSEQAKQTAQLQSEWQQKSQQLQSDSADQYEQLQSAYTQQEKHFKQQQAEMLEVMDERQTRLDEQDKRYAELLAEAQQEQQHCLSLQQSLHELSQQVAVGLTPAALEKIFLSKPVPNYALASVSGNVIDDYQRLLDWIRGKAAQLEALEQQLAAQIEPIQTESDKRRTQLRTQLTNLIQLISASRWPQVRRYAHFVQEIEKQVERLLSQTEQYLSTSKTAIGPQLGLNVLQKQEDSSISELPPARPLSTVYPTFKSIAGTPEKQTVMEGVNELGRVPVILTTNVVVAFTVHCTLDDFFELDILLGTCLRINTCQVRVIIRDFETKTALRVIDLEGVDIFDNYFYPIRFEAIADSKGKTYQVEIDSPDATDHSSIAIWCHPKQPEVAETQSLPEPVSPESLPTWIQQSLLALPVPARLSAESAQHGFVISGISASTPLLNVQVFFRALETALKQADISGQIVLSGQFNPDLQAYCEQHQLTALESTAEHVDLPLILEWGKKAKQLDYIWCCELTAIPQIDIAERAIEILNDCPDAGLLVPLEKHSDGKIRAGYALLMRDGLLHTHLAGQSADHPYYGYRRTIIAASSQLVLLKQAALSQIDIDAVRAYRTPMYQVTELIWQMKTQSYQAVYEAAFCYEQEAPYPAFTDSDYNQDSEYFYHRFQSQLPTHTSPFMPLGYQLNPEQQPSVLVIDATLPMFDEDSGSLRLYTLLKIWANLGYRITFIPDNLDSQFKYRHALEALGIEVFHGQYNMRDAMASRQFDFAFICRVDMGHRYIPYLRLLSPKTVIFYDTVDIHYIREQRQAEIENDPKRAENAQATKRKELSNCLLADSVITVTDDDAKHLQEELPQLVYSVIPNIHQLHPLPETPYAQREGLVFIGNYNHQPNEDGMYYFVETVLPKIQARLPDIRLYLIGSNMKEKMKALANETVKVIGWVDQVEPEFAQRRVFVSYLRYGAGMKGKLGQALSLGLPVVTTQIGAEGMGLEEGETALIADEPEAFAEAVSRLYTDSTLWEKLSHQGRDYIEHHYGENAVRDKLRDLLAHYH
ncbi:MAG TPA: glycosyltransferase [Thiotrichaceae bacterium]|nr:glycosyltransferase [Thiotrichaceae bacterium]